MSDKSKGKHWLTYSNRLSSEYKTVYSTACGYKSAYATKNINEVTCKTCMRLFKERQK